MLGPETTYGNTFSKKKNAIFLDIFLGLPLDGDNEWTSGQVKLCVNRKNTLIYCALNAFVNNYYKQKDVVKFWEYIQ